VANKITVLIDVVTDKATSGLKQFRTAISEADGAAGKLKAGTTAVGNTIKANMVPMLLAAGTAAAAFAAKSIRSASELEQSVGGVEKGFGDAAEAVLAIGENADEAMGLSKRAFNEGALALSAFAEDIAKDTGQPIEKVLTDLMQRAADFAAAYGTTVPEAIRVLSSTLAGESEPAKRYGIIVNETTTKAYAAANGMEELSKTTQRAGLFMQKTGKFAGQFADEADTLAGAQERARAKIENFEAKVGSELIPTVAKAVNVFSDLTDAMDKLEFSGGGLSESLSDNRTQLESLANGLENTLNPVQGFMQGFTHVRGLIDEVTGATERANKEWREAELAQSMAAKSAFYAAEATEELEEATEASADAQKDHRDAVKANTDKIKDLRSELLKGVDNSYDLEKATIALGNEVDKATKEIDEQRQALANSAPGSREHEAALRAIRSAQIGVAESALTTAQAYARQQGAADGSTLSSRLQVAELQRLQAQYPASAAEIQVYIDKLNAIPGVVSTRVDVNVGAANTALNNLNNRLATMGSQAWTTQAARVKGATWSHEGSIVGGPSFAGLKPDDVPMVLQKGQAVLTKEQQAAVLGAGGGGGNTYVTINTQADPQMVVDAIRKWERRNGGMR
jgi:hypothetical protein